VIVALFSSVLGHSGIDHVAIGAGGAALIAAYGAAWLRQPRTVRSGTGTPGASGWRLWAWAAGVALAVVASTPMVERLAEESFTGHMVQHLIVIVLAAPLLVVAQPLQTLVRSGAVPTTRIGRWAGAAWRRYAPVVGPLLFVGILFVTHLTSIYDRALGDRIVHELEHGGYLLGAVLTWTAVLGIGRAGGAARVGAVFGVGVGGALLGMILLSATEPLVPTYEVRLGAARALSDQRSAAALMWVSGMATTVPLLLVAVWRWASAEDRIARRTEALADHAARSRGVPR
jgi:putative membrane protein